jgi:hypothetical protein
MKWESIKIVAWMKKREIEDVWYGKKGVYGFCVYQPNSDDDWRKVNITIETTEEG